MLNDIRLHRSEAKARLVNVDPSQSYSDGIPKCPLFAAAGTSNTAFAPSYVPVAIFAGGTSAVQPDTIIAWFPKPTPCIKAEAEDARGWAHEFVQCDAMIMSAAGPKGNSMVESGQTPEGLDNHLAMRYFSRHIYTKELLPLLVCAQEKREHAHVMTVPATLAWRKQEAGQSAGYAMQIAALKGGIRGVGYNDGLVACQGQLPKGIDFYLAGECAQYILYALLPPDPARGGGLLMRDNHGDVASTHVLSADPKHKAYLVDDGSAGARKAHPDSSCPDNENYATGNSSASDIFLKSFYHFLGLTPEEPEIQFHRGL
ncbi:hypothetical protein B0H19DRAFT_1374067 [Mycena capillaripes]|nr:hypothetical protein B0H19DRAFT_1374067 [Mycena capillaripes]